MELTPYNSCATSQQQTKTTPIKAEWTPIFLAIFNQNKQEIKQLIKQGTDVNERSGFSKKTPLHEAVLFSFAITKTLLKRGADVNALDIYGQTPLHICMNFFNTEKTIELLLFYKADINIQTHKGKTALHKAVKDGDIKKINLLLAHNADGSITTHKGKTALDYAQKAHINSEHIQLIIAALEK
jgi:ankyrin repeat protein